ncbi:DUF5655 domain-containing protein [Thorsellia anophelis]|uniref:Predicted transport protein n=1 Tax=Thorsellia anophelis DSM 18579 TaxID=1123402 RepID=A0A1I0A7V7_9GAMM|nr:DUF5655 domain-containing protein [Thorsellia anophelis]SES89320.1 Predicted transport protein [Thorsellia anophelis DSM 18579]
MKLFTSKQGSLAPIDEQPFALEKHIQQLTEANMDKVFGLEFIKSEFALNNFRLDSVCFDPINKCFVIIEYKNGKQFSVIDQGFSYLSLLINNKAEFVLLYNEYLDEKSKHHALRKEDVDWSQSRVIFVSPSYTVFQKESINFKDLPFELWEIKQYTNGTVLFSPIKATKQTESINFLSQSNPEIFDVVKEVKVYNESDHLHDLPTTLIERYERLRDEILNLGDITLVPRKKYLAFTGSKRNIVDLVLTKSKIKVYINLKYSEIDDPKKRVRDITHIGSWGNGDCEFIFEKEEELDYLLMLIKQSLRVNG